MTKQEKSNAIVGIMIKQAILLALFKLETNPHKQADLYFNIVGLEVQKGFIIETPIPKFPKGGIYYSGIETFGEIGKKIIINPIV